MTCDLIFLAVGNADSIIVSPDGDPSVVIDLPQPRVVSDYLASRRRLKIGGIYITHSHRDHFAPLSEFVAFLDQWLDLGGYVDTAFIPIEAFEDAFTTLERLRTKRPTEYKELQHAISRLMELRVKTINLQHPNRSATPSYQLGPLAIYVLHPDQLFAAGHRTRFHNRLNERSVVLKVTYKGFSALLLADVEKDGLDDILKLYLGTPEVLKSDLVKIPHHGAWPINSSSLEALLRIVDARLAILSVGSKNAYGHVVPELFKLLNQLVDDTSLQLKNFLCTEVTRTCVFSFANIAELGKRGLAERKRCAGDITVTVHDEIAWNFDTETDHRAVISGLKYPACEHQIKS